MEAFTFSACRRNQCHLRLQPPSAKLNTKLQNRRSRTSHPPPRCSRAVDRVAFAPITCLSCEMSDRLKKRREGNLNTITVINGGGSIGQEAGDAEGHGNPMIAVASDFCPG